MMCKLHIPGNACWPAETSLLQLGQYELPACLGLHHLSPPVLTLPAGKAG